LDNVLERSLYALCLKIGYTCVFWRQSHTLSISDEDMAIQLLIHTPLGIIKLLWLSCYACASYVLMKQKTARVHSETYLSPDLSRCLKAGHLRAFYYLYRRVIDIIL